MSSDSPSRLASPKAKRSTTKTRKSTKPVKTAKGDHPSWKDIIRVSRSTVDIIDFTDRLFRNALLLTQRKPEPVFLEALSRRFVNRRAFQTRGSSMFDSSLKIVMASSLPRQISRT